MDVQVLDLYYFLRKVMEKHHWDVKFGDAMLEMYSRIRPLSQAEIEYISLKLIYPEKFWKVANAYYQSNKAWQFGKVWRSWKRRSGRPKKKCGLLSRYLLFICECLLYNGNILFWQEVYTMEYKERYEEWLSNPYFDTATKAELESIKDDENEIKERFYTDLEFGTAGLRGIIGAGTNRMNIYTVRKATQGLANYIHKSGNAQKGVAVAYDSRRMSPEFADEAALCLAANGIKAYVFESLRPTPELSYAVRKLGCIAGINITASHNPPEYNGYKVYWEDGAQITPPHDKGIMDDVKAIEDYTTMKTMSLDAAKEAGTVRDDRSRDRRRVYCGTENTGASSGCGSMQSEDLKIVYTPLHGTGNIPARRTLKELGFENVYVVKEQELPDGEFPTVSYPNPEAAEAFDLGLKLAKEVDADIVLAVTRDRGSSRRSCERQRRRISYIDRKYVRLPVGGL